MLFIVHGIHKLNLLLWNGGRSFDCRTFKIYRDTYDSKVSDCGLCGTFGPIFDQVKSNNLLLPLTKRN